MKKRFAKQFSKAPREADDHSGENTMGYATFTTPPSGCGKLSP
jgi:hypothetical protein